MSRVNGTICSAKDFGTTEYTEHTEGNPGEKSELMPKLIHANETYENA